jgi:hypothetical protein
MLKIKVQIKNPALWQNGYYRYGKKIPNDAVFTEDEIYAYFKGACRSAEQIFQELKKDPNLKVEKYFTDSEKQKSEIKQEIKQAAVEEIIKEEKHQEEVKQKKRRGLK